MNEFKRGRTSTCDAPRSGHSIEVATPEIINPDEFLRRFITVDEIWIHHFTPETKEQSKQWTSPDEPAPKKVKTVKLTGKVVMATVFWDARGIIHIDYLPLKQTINDDYYAALLDHFNNILKKKRSHLAKKKVFFHQDNARVHTCPAPMAKFNEFRYELLPHPARFRQI